MQFLEWCLLHKTEAIIILVVIFAILIFAACAIIRFIRIRKGKGLFIFRRYKKYEGPPDNKQQHPKLIVDDTGKEYGFMGLTESAKHGKATNIPIKNPQKGNKRKSYIRKEVRYAEKENFFDGKLKNYKLARKDKKKIKKYLENKKKK